MFGRPRCREWTPLVTQQLRLRSLIQIVGYNIRPPESCQSPCSFYITLHHTTMSAPFYTSERISSPHPKWKEIDSEITRRMASTNVVVRIWCHIMRPSKCDDKGEGPQDTVIQTWGVYFSGLRYIGANLALNFTSDCFKSNTLVFQMQGGYFCSYKSLKLDIIPPENENEHGSLSSDSSGRTNLSKTIESKFIQHHKVKESRSISPNKYSRKNEKEYSKSNSPVERGFKQNFPTLKTSTSMNIGQSQKSSRNREESAERKKVAPNYIYEHSPDNLDVTTCEAICDNLSKTSSREQLSGSKIDLSETAESYDLRNESECPKYRYLALSFLKSEIRPSYNATKLQKLHLLQYAIKKKQEAVQEIKERIYKKSALTSDTPLNEINVHSRFKSRSQRNLFSPEDVSKNMCLSQNDLSKNGRIKDDKPPVSNGPRLTLKLNDLLSFKEKPSPLQRAEHVRLTKQLEILRFKRIILTDERDSKLANIRKLKEKHAKLLEENQDVGLELMQGYHSLSRRQERGRGERASAAALRELAGRTAHALANARAALLRGLLLIFYIDQKDTQWTICDVPLPVCGDESPRASPVSDSVAAGLVAQATTLAAAILAQPMRYKVTLLGSASKILDVTPDLPDPNIPLFSRGGDTTLFWYAMFLMNKCIAQLLWGRGVAVQDMRPTLANLRRLLSAPAIPVSPGLSGAASWSGPRAQSLRSLVAGDRGRHGRQFNRFKDSVDGQSPTSAMNLRRHRHSRSVGSYHDDQEISNLEASTTSIMGSEPDIYNAKLQQNESEPRTIVKHSSESEISRLSTDQDSVNKVLFTLGEDSKLAGLTAEKLVRISSNNGDGGNSEADVKKICSEIEDFCSVKTDHDAIDVAKHITANDVDIVKYMEQNAVKEEEDVCGDCETNVDGLCDIECAKNVTEVIVIPSAEAILDTGQSEAFSADRDQ